MVNPETLLQDIKRTTRLSRINPDGIRVVSVYRGSPPEYRLILPCPEITAEYNPETHKFEVLPFGMNPLQELQLQLDVEFLLDAENNSTV